MGETGSDNIIKLTDNHHSARMPARFREPLDDCRKITLNNLASGLKTLLEQTDDALFELAEKAPNNVQQTLCFDTMREIRRQRMGLTRQFHQGIAKLFRDFPPQASPTDQKPTEISSETLTLVGHEVYEDTLQIANLGNRMSDRCSEELYALERRLAIINNGRPTDDSINPLSPRRIVEVFSQCLTPLALHNRIKPILYSLFEKHILTQLAKTYEEVNKRLIEADILPNIKYSRRIISHGHASPASSANTGSAKTGRQQPDAISTTATNRYHSPERNARSTQSEGNHQPEEQTSTMQKSWDSDIYKAIQQLMAGSKQSQTATATPSQPIQTHTQQDLLTALTRIQKRVLNENTHPFTTKRSAKEFKTTLMKELAHQHGGNKALEEQASDTIDLISMVFDHIGGDRQLPRSYRNLFTHMQLPFIHSALEEPELLQNDNHPARQLLNSMADAAVQFEGAGHFEEDLRRRSHLVVESLLNSNDDDQEHQFKILLNDFRDHLDVLEHKARIIEQRSIEASKGHDRLLIARRQAASDIRNLIHKKKLPVFAREFLASVWTDLLVFTLLRHENGATYKKTMALTKSLVDILSGQKSDLAPEDLLKEVTIQLQSLGSYQQNHIERLVGNLSGCLQGHTTDNSVLRDLGAKPVDTEMPAPQPEHQKISKSTLEQLEKLAFGSRLEFKKGDQLRTLKLAWFSPDTGRYMFVDAAGSKAELLEENDLSHQIEAGAIRILPEHSPSVVSRALGSIYKILKIKNQRKSQ